MEYLSFCIDRWATVRDAMHQLDRTAKKILFAVDGIHLVASLTDGDVRRYLLSGGKMDDSVDKAANHHPKAAGSREQAHEMFQNNGFLAIPIVNGNGELVDVAFEDESTAPVFPKLGLPVVIMAGGKGTRLDPFTRVLPKPLIPVGDVPIIEHIMERFMQYGCEDFHVIVNHKKQLIKAYFAENERQYLTSWYDEEEPLGTGGGLFLLKSEIYSTFFLTNCDILIQADYDDILRFHKENENAVTMVCAYKNLTIPYGVIEIGDNGTIKSMQEKPELSFLTNTGMYIVEPEILSDIEDNIPMSFPDIIEIQKNKGRRVAAYPISESCWLDMGQMTELKQMREKLYGRD